MQSTRTINWFNLSQFKVWGKRGLVRQSRQSFFLWSWEKFSWTKQINAVISFVPMKHRKKATMYSASSESALICLLLIYYKNDVNILRNMSPLGKSNHQVLVFDFHIVKNILSAQFRSNIWKAYIQDIVYSTSSTDWTIELKFLLETIWQVLKYFYMKLIPP